LQHSTENESISKLTIFLAPRFRAPKEKIPLPQPISKKLLFLRSFKPKKSIIDDSAFLILSSFIPFKKFFQFFPKEKDAALEEKTQEDMNRISEFHLMEKCSNKFDETFVFTSDKKKYQKYMPKKCFHVPVGGRLSYLFFSWLIILRYVIKYRIDIVFVEGCTALPSIFLINKITGVRTFLNYNYLWHFSYSWDKKKKLAIKIRENKPIAYIFKIFEKILIQFIDYFLAATTDIKIFIHNKSKILNTKKGIILNKFQSNTTKQNPLFSNIDGISLLFTSRLVPNKNPITLIEAYKIAKKKIPKLNLIICGDGELMNECKKNSDEDMYLLGFVKNIPSFLKGADVFILAPDYEASPRSLMEAMAMGLPCIATKVGGIPDYLDETCGVFVEPKNPEMLAEKIVYLIENKKIAKELGRRAREKMLKYHDLDKNLDKILDFMIKQVKKDNI
jgi:glycosyltransferase involved in cell wall biosynthesis